MTLESKLQALVAHWKAESKRIKEMADKERSKASKDSLMAQSVRYWMCADELAEALLAERLPVDATLLDLAQEILKPHWPVVRNMEENEARQREVERIVNVLKRVAVPALAERQEPLMDYLPDGSPSHGPYPGEIADREQQLRESVELLGQGQMDLAHELCEAQAKLARVIRLTKEWYKPKHQPREGRTVCECHFCFQQRSDADELKEVLDGKLLAAQPSSGTGERE